MSCWRECASQVHNTNLETLKQAAERMGLGINENVKRVATSYGNYERNEGNVNGAFTKNGRPLQLGYVLSSKEDNTLKIVGDFWSTGLSSETFMGELGQIYRTNQMVA